MDKKLNVDDRDCDTNELSIYLFNCIDLLTVSKD